MRPVSAWQWFALGVMAAYTPSLVFLAAVLWRAMPRPARRLRRRRFILLAIGVAWLATSFLPVIDHVAEHGLAVLQREARHAAP